MPRFAFTLPTTRDIPASHTSHPTSLAHPTSRRYRRAKQAYPDLGALGTLFQKKELKIEEVADKENLMAALTDMVNKSNSLE